MEAWKAVILFLLHSLCFRATNAQDDSDVTITAGPGPFRAGEQFPVSFTSDVDDGDSGDDLVRITLARGNPGATVQTLTDNGVGGSFSWTIDATLPAGDDYFLQIQQDDDFASFGPFTIEAAPEPEAPEPSPEPTPTAPAPTPAPSEGDAPAPSDASEAASDEPASATSAAAEPTALEDQIPGSATATEGAALESGSPGSGGNDSAANGNNANNGGEGGGGGGGGGLPTGAAIGIGVGAGVAVMIIAIVFFIFWRKKRSQRLARQHIVTAGNLEKSGTSSEPDSSSFDHKAAYLSSEPSELASPVGSPTYPAELDASEKQHEMGVPGFIPASDSAKARELVGSPVTSARSPVTSTRSPVTSTRSPVSLSQRSPVSPMSSAVERRNST